MLRGMVGWVVLVADILLLYSIPIFALMSLMLGKSLSDGARWGVQRLVEIVQLGLLFL